ncbi:MAG: 50S ribosomal protein L11 methyltransferase [Bacteroidia bacterium]|nr:50S ribosomal protein L11 methyltransferase [Bacteroidia bacterium]
MSIPSNYIEYSFSISPLKPASEILVAQLDERGFESFIETVDGLLAYIPKSDWSTDILDNIQVLKSKEFAIKASWKEIETQNWNAIWERDFKPIYVSDQCMVRASFHESVDVRYDIVIDPKMSFGTGHHETTYMMIELLLEMDLENKSVLDMGCGTAVLAILAELKGAKDVLAIDIDHWSYRNATENCLTNSCERITILEGDVGLIRDRSFDIIIANINRNVLMQDIPAYSRCLNPGGTLLLSGFYEKDSAMIEEICTANMLKPLKKIERHEWISLKFLN